MSIVTTKGQATIPKHIREHLNIKPGETDVDFVVVNDHVELVNKQNHNPFAKMRGITKGKMSTKEIMALSRD
ncbi:MAG: AbrB family looped-hinge helix DNA binding protein [Phenylobacterium sp.]|jgi:AbrB family looped-hinge helix DNA binding protein